jgi:hypothetical protein
VMLLACGRLQGYCENAADWTVSVELRVQLAEPSLPRETLLDRDA